MKKIHITALLALTACLATLAYGASVDDHLAAMKKCAVCSAMAEKPELMKDMVWETHKIDSGMLCVASVPKDQEKDFEALHEKMMKNIEKVKSEVAQGKPVELCEFCQGMSGLEKAGAKHQEVKTAVGFVTLMTSDEPAVVEKIHAQADKAIAMQKEMASQHGESSTN